MSNAYKTSAKSTCIAVAKGFHAALNISRFDNCSESIIAECVIPAGSLVFYDKTGLVAANQMKLIKILKDE